MRFEQKLYALMRREALSNLGLGKALGGIAHTTVAAWLEGSKPRTKAAQKLARYFSVPVELLLDDTEELPSELLTAKRSPTTLGHVLSSVDEKTKKTATLGHFAHGHLQTMETLLDLYISGRRDKEFEFFLRQYTRNKERGFSALATATQLLDTVGKFALTEKLQTDANATQGDSL